MYIPFLPFLLPSEVDYKTFLRSHRSVPKGSMEEQKKDLKDKLSKTEEVLKELIRKLYRMVLIPSKDGVKELDLGRIFFKRQKHTLYQPCGF